MQCSARCHYKSRALWLVLQPHVKARETPFPHAESPLYSVSGSNVCCLVPAWKEIILLSAKLFTGFEKHCSVDNLCNAGVLLRPESPQCNLYGLRFVQFISETAAVMVQNAEVVIKGQIPHSMTLFYLSIAYRRIYMIFCLSECEFMGS